MGGTSIIGGHVAPNPKHPCNVLTATEWSCGGFSESTMRRFKDLERRTRKPVPTFGSDALASGGPQHLPVPIEDGVYFLHQEGNAGDEECKQARERGWADYIHEHTIATHITMVDRAVDQRVIKDEEG